MAAACGPRDRSLGVAIEANKNLPHLPYRVDDLISNRKARRRALYVLAMEGDDGEMSDAERQRFEEELLTMLAVEAADAARPCVQRVDLICDANYCGHDRESLTKLRGRNSFVIQVSALKKLTKCRLTNLPTRSTSWKPIAKGQWTTMWR